MSLLFLELKSNKQNVINRTKNTIKLKGMNKKVSRSSGNILPTISKGKSSNHDRYNNALIKLIMLYANSKSSFSTF